MDCLHGFLHSIRLLVQIGHACSSMQTALLNDASVLHDKPSVNSSNSITVRTYAGLAGLIIKYSYDNGIIRENIHRQSNEYGCKKSKYYTTWNMNEIAQNTALQYDLVMVYRILIISKSSCGVSYGSNDTDSIHSQKHIIRSRSILQELIGHLYFPIPTSLASSPIILR